MASNIASILFFVVQLFLLIVPSFLLDQIILVRCEFLALIGAAARFPMPMTIAVHHSNTVGLTANTAAAIEAS